ncbi:uncharacterized protein [Pseudorasbora parva]|uniref:uncharacterized protein n=1 Tax=Pseudorasbora parva TaxID=51549 RepID=UPI00351DD990
MVQNDQFLKGLPDFFLGNSESGISDVENNPTPIRKRSSIKAHGSGRRHSNSRHVHSTPVRERSRSSSRAHGSGRRHSTSRHETPRAPTGNSMDVFPMPMAKFQACGLKKLVEIAQEVRRIGTAEPISSSFHIKRMGTTEELHTLEDKLHNSEERDILITQLSKIGGKNIRDCSTKILDRLMTNSLMAQLNMKGHGSKTAFQCTALYSTMIDAIKKWNGKATDHDIYKAVGDHLKHAPGRSGGGGYTAND